MGLPRQVLNSLIAKKVVEVAAQRMGIDVTPEEVREAIEAQMQDQGKFIGIDRYKEILAQNNISVTEFEQDVFYRQLAKKLQQVVTDSLSVSDRELRDEFARTNQQMVVDYVLLKKDDVSKRIKPTEAELRAYFDSHKDTYRIREKRRAQYLLTWVEHDDPNVSAFPQDG